MHLPVGYTALPPSPARIASLALSSALWAPGLWAAAAAVVVYAASWRNGFAWDDAYLIVDNPSVHGFGRAWEWFALPWASGSSDAQGRAQNALYWRPLTQASYALDWLFGGGRPLAFHVTNTALHAVASASVAAAVTAGWARWSEKPKSFWPGALAGVLFAVHPVHGEAVNLATYRSTLLVGACSLTAVWLHVRRPEGHRWGELILYAVGLLSKEDAAILPALLALVDVTMNRPRPSILVIIRRYIPFIAIFGLWWVARSLVTSPPLLDFFAGASKAEVVMTMLEVFLLDLRLLAIPWPLTPFYDWTILPIATTAADPGVLAGGCLLLLAVGALVMGVWRGWRVAALLSGWFVVALAPYSHVLPFFDAAGERFLYVPAAAACAGVGIAVALALARTSSPGHRLGSSLLGKGALATALSVTTVFAVMSARRVPHFDSTRMLLAKTAELFPHSFNAHYELGRVAMAEGQAAEALAHVQRAHALVPRLEAGTLAVVDVLVAMGRMGEARAFLEREMARMGQDAPESYRARLDALMP